MGCGIPFFVIKWDSFVAVGVSKQDIREQIWDHMESQNLADFPRPVHHRIPNFKVLTHFWSLEKENKIFRND